jgi:hypothetical protein
MNVRFTPRKRTSAERIEMSVMGHKQASPAIQGSHQRGKGAEAAQ